MSVLLRVFAGKFRWIGVSPMTSSGHELHVIDRYAEGQIRLLRATALVGTGMDYKRMDFLGYLTTGASGPDEPGSALAKYLPRPACWRIILRILMMFGLLLSWGCSTSVTQVESTDYKARAETKVDGGVHISASVLSDQESAESFLLPLDKKRIQPVWIEIENTENTEFNLMLLSIDPNYFSPSEVAWSVRHVTDTGSGKRTSLEQKTTFFFERHIPVVIPPRSTVSGYVYTNLDPGRKAFAVDLFGANVTRTVEFVQSVPGFEADYSKVDFDSLYPPGQIRDLSLAQLRRYLERLPCCVAGGDRKTDGDPLNLVIVGDGDLVLATLVRQGWDLTETMRFGSMWQTVLSSLFKSSYRTSPVSSLYLFDRPQDVAFQKARGSVDERNHLRLWRAPVTLNGREVWVGQISRDIGVKLSSVTVVTHKIDPVVDEARFYVALDTTASQSLKAVGYVSGVGESNLADPRHNFTRDPYYTDGNRVVLILSDERTQPDKIRYLNWEHPKKINRWVKPEN